MNGTRNMPCRKCREKTCAGKKCGQFHRWFLGAWEDINRFSWKLIDAAGEKCVPIKNPCQKCICKEWCDSPCSLRLKWWDITMKKLQKKLGGGLL